MLKYSFAIVFSLFSVAARVLPHISNVAPIGALALWSGAYLPKRWGWGVPIAAMLASDAVVGFYDWRLMVVVYGSFTLTTLIGRLIRQSNTAPAVLLGSLAGSTLFFLTTNFAVWTFSEWYPHTFQGLVYAYTLGLPFFRNTLLGDLFYTAIMFGVYVLTRQFCIRSKLSTPMFLRTLE